MRRLQRRRLPLALRQVGHPGEADFSRAPRLHAGPFDDVVERLRLLRGQERRGALRSPGAAGIDADGDIAQRDPVERIGAFEGRIVRQHVRSHRRIRVQLQGAIPMLAVRCPDDDGRPGPLVRGTKYIGIEPHAVAHGHSHIALDDHPAFHGPTEVRRRRSSLLRIAVGRAQPIVGWRRCHCWFAPKSQASATPTEILRVSGTETRRKRQRTRLPRGPLAGPAPGRRARTQEVRRADVAVVCFRTHTNNNPEFFMLAVESSARGAASPTFGRYQVILVALLSLNFGILFFDRNALSFVMPFVKPDLGLNNTQVGLTSSALSLAWAVSALFIGARADRSGRRKRYLVAVTVAFSLCSCATGLTHSFFMLVGSRLLMGMADGGIAPISQSITALAVPPERRGVAMGVMQNFGSNLLGSFAAPALLGGFAAAYGWHTAFYPAGGPGLISAFLLW